MTVRYLVESHTNPMLMIGMALKDWGLGFELDSRELTISIGPFFFWWAFR